MLITFIDLYRDTPIHIFVIILCKYYTPNYKLLVAAMKCVVLTETKLICISNCASAMHSSQNVNFNSTMYKCMSKVLLQV